MDYIVLSRKYRPQQFNEVIGQQVIITTLINAIKSKRIAHSYLFTGNHGIGKTTIARILAKSLSCQKGITIHPCNKCSSCIEITKGRSIDIIEFDGASNTGVDDIRILKDNTRYLPTNTRFKIFIIDEVHMLSNNAFNALLKTLEEPPEYVKFILATTEPYKIPFTILSRCQQYHLNKINTNEIKNQLKNILINENINIPDNSIHDISNMSNGSMRDALNLLDQIISFADNNLSEDNINKILGITPKSEITKITYSLINGNFSIVLNFIEKYCKQNISILQIIESIAIKIRNLCVIASGGSLKHILNEDINEFNYLQKKIKTLDLNDLKYLLKVAINGVQKIQTSEKPRLALELCFLEMAIRPKLKTMTNINYAIKKLELLTQDNLKNINKHENNKKAKEQFDIITKTLKTPTKSYTNTKKKCNLSIDEQKHEYHPKENKNINESNNTKQEQKLKKNIFIKKTLELFGGEIILTK